jgi:hypothetical protein
MPDENPVPTGELRPGATIRQYRIVGIIVDFDRMLSSIYADA